MVPLIVSAILSIFIFGFVTITEFPTSMPEIYGALAQENSNEHRLPQNSDRQLPLRIEESETFRVYANSSAVWDIGNRYFVFEKKAEEPLPIASITKLMTALTFLDYNPGWETEYTMHADDRREGGKIFFYQGEKFLVRDLFYASLVGSINTETIALVHSTGMSEAEFVEAMNKKAFELGLFQTSFIDATGLSEKNISTAKDVARLASFALINEDISLATLTEEYRTKTLDGASKIIRTTDELLYNFNKDDIQVLGGKTGFTENAGYCFVGVFTDSKGRRIVSVILGAPDIDARFRETIKLVEAVYQTK